MEFKLKRYKFKIILFSVASLLLLSHLGKIEVNIMEARNFISAREMVQNQEYLLTTLNNEPRYQKPPLPTWLTALSGRVFGFDSVFFLRLPVVVITLLLVFAYFHFCMLIGMTEKNSFIYTLILITSFYIFFSGRDNQWDMYTHSFMLVSIFFIWKLFSSGTHQLRNCLLAGLFFGFSMLSKGPISLYTLFLPFLISYGLVYHIPLKKKWPYFLGILVTGITVGLSWYVYVRLKDPQYFSDIVEKEAANWKSYEVKPFYYYWNFFLQSGLWTLPSLVALCYPYMKNRVRDKNAYKFALIWTLAGVVLMSLIPEKKVRYLVPVLIPLALTTGFYIEYLISSAKDSFSRKDSIVTWIVFGFLALIGFIYPVAMAVVLKESLKQYAFIYIFSSVAMIAISLFIVGGLRMVKFELVFGSMISMFSVVVLALIPVSKIFFNNPLYFPASKAELIADEVGIKTYRLSDISPELVWNFGGTVTLLKIKDEKIQFPSEKKFGLMAADTDSLLLKTGFSNYVLEKKCRIDMGTRKKRKDRLIKDFYIATRKE
ncbi:MAG: glycosyltransferase family 39 protein [Bacteroidales bacterium]|nr:glycosyltransferase family 39 protein [Bacteroidales bacterium]